MPKLRAPYSFALILALSSIANADECVNGQRENSIDESSLIIKYSGREFGLKIKDLFSLSVGENTLQKMDKSTQILNQKIRAIVASYNSCVLNDEQFREQLSYLTGYRDNVEAMQALLTDIDALKSSSGKTNQTIAQLQNKYNQLYRNVALYQTQLIAFGNDISEIKNDYEYIDSTIERLKDNIYLDIKYLDIRLGNVEKELEIIRDLIMSRKDHDYSFNVLGISVEGLRLDNRWRPYASLVLEKLFSNRFGNISPLVELGYLYWDDNMIISTLPGAPAIEDSDINSFIDIGIGLNYYLKLREGIHTQIGVRLGYSVETDETYNLSTWNASLTMGATYYPIFPEATFFFRLSSYEVKHKRIEFIPFGDANIYDDDKRYLVASLGLKWTFSKLIW